MSDFDFDRPIKRAGTASTKWDKYAGRDILPLWVADMDFACAPPILDAMHARVEHGVFGYTEPSAELTKIIVRALQRDYGWRIEPDWLLWLPGLVSGINVMGGRLTSRPVAEAHGLAFVDAASLLAG